MSTERPALLRARGLGKRYAGVPALAGVDLDVRGGEVLAIVGENGAGKSTLLRILSGVTQPDEGVLELAGADGALRAAALRSVRDATAAGIAFVHQELNLAENLDVAGNIYLGREPSRRGFLDIAAMHEGARGWLARVGLDVKPSARCGALPIAERQLVEIAKALSRDARILVLDEPTSSLSAREAETLFGIIESLRARGTAVVFVSHHLDEVTRLADRVLVLRDGRPTGERARGAFDRAGIERLMVGRDIAAPPPRHAAAAAPVRLRLEAFVSARRGARPVTVDVRAGEIVGLAGLVGAGRTELLESIAGIAPHRGSVRLDGVPLPGGAPARVARGVAIVPEDRARHGILAPDPMRTNVSLAWIGRQGAAVRPAAEDSMARRVAAQVRLRPGDPERTVETLSGGNQQKAVLARWIAVSPAVLLLDEPTRGVDVGARADIHAEVRRLADAGTAVLVASSELEEVLMLADRVLVMHEGAVVGDLPVQDAGEVAIMHLATGGGPAASPGSAA